MSFLQNILSAFRPQQESDPLQSLTVCTYGQAASGIEADEAKSVIEWIALSLKVAGCTTDSHLFWVHPDGQLTKELRRLYRKGEPVLGYRLGDRMAPAPEGMYWRMVTEHPSTRIYQLEPKDE